MNDGSLRVLGLGDLVIGGNTVDVDATIVGIVPFLIQDDPYLTIYYVHDEDPDTVLQARLPSSAVYAHPHPNDTVRVHYVLGVVTHMHRREASPAPAAAEP